MWIRAWFALVGMVPSLAAQEWRELDWKQGTVELAGGVATAELPAGWCYLEGRDARWVVEEVWGNPPDPEVTGMIWPSTPEECTPDLWAIIVSYQDDGHIDDSDAASIDYDEILEGMQTEARDSNEARVAAGYGTMDVLGWAEPPKYDSAAKKLYWAKLLQFGGEDYVTLNYDVRVLGRHGALVLGAVAIQDELDQVAAGCQEILAVTEFKEGYRYSDFDASIDSYAAYGLGGLVAGKVLAKAGFFKALLLFLGKGWKLIALVGVGIAASWRKIFGRPAAEAEA